MDIKSLYVSEITSQSKVELELFTKWLNTTHGNWATVIGGWAVWSHYPDGYGSRDIDLILPDGKWIEQVLINEYFPLREIKKYKLGDPIFGEPHYGKEIIRDDGSKELLFFDLTPADFPREDPEKLNVTVDWNWVFDYSVEKPLGNYKINVPEIELLIPLKIIACLSREKTLLKAADQTYWLSKIWKDCYDVSNLITHVELAKHKMNEHMNRVNLRKDLINEFLSILESRNDVLEQTNSKIDLIEKQLDG